MTPDELNARLRAAHLPQWSEDYRTHFAAEVVRRAAARTTAPRPPRRWFAPALAAAAAACGLAAGFALWHRHAPPTDRPLAWSPPSGTLQVWIEFEDHGRRQTLVSFSGQSIRWQGRTLEVLANPDGQVMLVGDAFVWSNRDAGPELADAPLPVHARVIRPTPTF